MMENQLKSLLRTTPDAILGIDHQGKITLWNRAATKMFGHSAKEAIGRDLHSLIVPHRTRRKARKGLAVFAETGKGPLVGKTTECTARRKDGFEFPVELSISAFRQDDHWYATGIIRDISERKKIHESLVASEEKFRQLANKSLVGIYIVQDGVFKYVNPKLAEIFGYAEKELIDKLGPEQVVFEEDWPLVKENLRKRIEGEVESVHYTFRAMTKDKKVIEIEAFGSFTHYQGRPAIIGTLLDISERKRTEMALHTAEQRARKIIETALDAFVSINAKGVIIEWNRRAEEMFGWSRKEALGRKLTETIIPQEFRKMHQKGLKHYLATGEGAALNKQVEVMALHRDGYSCPVELSIVPVHTDDGVTFHAFIRDIRAQVQAQEILLRSTEQIRASLIGTIVAVSRAVGARDPYTASHQQRVAQLARSIAQEMGLDTGRIDGLRLGATIHDIGKIYLPAEILAKPAKLTDIEYELIKSHAQVGYDILKDIEFPWPIADIAYQHHERLDGSGYPQGLKGDEICLEARIVAVADVVEAISSHRPYRPALGIDTALKEIESKRGKFYDPDAVDACLKLFREKRFSFGNE